MAVMIGIDPHKGSHTAVALDQDEQPVGELLVRSAAGQVERLVQWATPLAARTWAIEGAGGLGHLLAQGLVAAGERVVDVRPKLAARVRLLATGSSNKNDPNDARSVAVAALRSTVPEVRAEDHVKVMKVWAKRHRDLSSHRTRIACRLHAVLCELTPGGLAGEISAAQATRLLDELEPAGAVAAARHTVASELVADLRRLDDQRGDTTERITAAVKASTTTLTGRFGVGPTVAATIIGDVADIGRFPSRDRFAADNGTAPIEVSSGERRRKLFRLSRRGNRRLNHAIHLAAVTQIRHRHRPAPRLLRPQDRRRPQRQSSDPRPHAAHQRRCLAPRRRRPGRTTRRGPGRAHGERLCRQRRRLTPRTPALRPGHSRTRHHPTTSAPPNPPGTADADPEAASTKSLLTQTGLVRRWPTQRAWSIVPTPIARYGVLAGGRRSAVPKAGRREEAICLVTSATEGWRHAGRTGCVIARCCGCPLGQNRARTSTRTNLPYGRRQRESQC
ncbi:MAG TPA: transposase [Jiangellaceae bacterium]|nr:transposase [Jiangellaceae bacterium]